MNTKLNDVRLSLDGVRLSPNLTSSSEAALSHSSELDGVRLSPHFMLKEFLKLSNYPDNIPTMQVVANLTYGCHQLLTGNGWLHISWNPFAAPRHYVRIGYYH